MDRTEPPIGVINEDESNEQNNKQNENAVVPGGDQDAFEQEGYDPIDGTEEMTESEIREAALMNDYLGKQIVCKKKIKINFVKN